MLRIVCGLIVYNRRRLSSVASRFKLEFGDLVRRTREDRGLSQEGLADAAGLHRTHISLIERGGRSVRLETIERLAVALSVQPAELMPKVKFKGGRRV